jgi:uncharacterized protein (TIGR00369 family)
VSDSDAFELARAFQKRVPFIGHLGIVTESLGAGRAQLRLALRPELTNSFGAAHGGTILTLLDVAAATATRTLHPDSRGVITIDLSTSFLDAGKGELVAEARVLRDGRSAVFVEAEVRGADGALVARAMATCRAIEPDGTR